MMIEEDEDDGWSDDEDGGLGEEMPPGLPLPCAPPPGLENVSNNNAFFYGVDEQQQEQQQGQQYAYGQQPEQPQGRQQGGGASVSSMELDEDLTRNLERLAALHFSGALTKAEFQLAKAKSLGI